MSKISLIISLVLTLQAGSLMAAQVSVEELRVGMIGLDTSHCIAFTEILNDPKPQPDVAHCRVVAAYPKGSPDIESSVRRIPRYTAQIRKMGVEIVDSIDELLSKVDVVLLETNDGRPHRQQALAAIKAGKTLFIDKPIAGSLADAVVILEAAERYGVPVFASSSLRYTAGAQEIRGGKIGSVLGADVYSPATIEKTHPDLFWYGIHGVELLFTVMGPGCESVVRAHTVGTDLVVGTWKDGRIGTFRGIRQGRGDYGGTVFGSEANSPIGPYSGYRPLLVEIVKFFRTGIAPIDPAETLEIYAFMEAADESKRQGGVPIPIATILSTAREQARDLGSQLEN